MDTLTLEPRTFANGEVQLPGSKSLSNRILLLAALAEGKTRVTNLLDSADVSHMLNALTELGVNYELAEDRRSCVVGVWVERLRQPKQRCSLATQVQRCAP